MSVTVWRLATRPTSKVDIISFIGLPPAIGHLFLVCNSAYHIIYFATAN